MIDRFLHTPLILGMWPLELAGWACVALIVFGEIRQWQFDRRTHANNLDFYDRIDTDLDTINRRLEAAGIPGLHHPDATDTGPINVLDRPTPAQQAAPTRPDLTVRRPVPAGRHRAPEGAK